MEAATAQLSRMTPECSSFSKALFLDEIHEELVFPWPQPDSADRVRARFDHIEHNDDERMSAIAKLAYKRGSYGYALFED
jgi:hypothetical protein